MSQALDLPLVEEGLDRLEPLLTSTLVTGEAFLDSVTTHLIAAGGKRLRPLLALAAATGGERSATEDQLMGAVSVELVHLASLYHDDVLDEATIRRNVESVNSRFGNLVAIVAGDYLLARSAAIAASLGTEVAQLLAETLARLCQGQVSEVRSAFQITRSHQDYTTAIAGKTAALLSTSCRIGALTGDLPRAEVDALTEYGHCFGMVFQIRDDILDITATAGELLKPAGQDLAEGIYTLPALVALADPNSGPDLRGAARTPTGPARAGEGVRHRGRVRRGSPPPSPKPPPMSSGPGWPPRGSPTTPSRRAWPNWPPNCSATCPPDAPTIAAPDVQSRPARTGRL